MPPVPDPPRSLRTLPDVLLRAAAEVPERGVAFVDADAAVVHRPYPKLRNAALRVAAGLRSADVAPGDVVMLAPATNEDFVPAFWGCLFAGVVPAPLPPAERPGTTAAERLTRVAEVLHHPPILVSQPTDLLPDAPLLLLPDLLTAAPAEAAYEAEPDALAFLQFSSGSTGHPKGVRLTHRNVLANLAAIQDRLGTHRGDRSLSWLPLFHDMGLVGFHLSPMYTGITHWLLPTARFLRRPLLWLDLLDQHAITVTAAPNFSQALVLEHAARRPEQRWDLSPVRAIFNGAEPIAAGVMDRFLQTMAAHGLRPEAMLPAYGLAEAVLAVAAVEPSEQPRVEAIDRTHLLDHGRAMIADAGVPALPIVGCGRVLDGQAVRVVGNDGTPLDEGAVGHIETQGANVTAGYYHDAAATAAAFRDGWLRTGDLGYLRNGELFVTGRLKDLLFVNGQNLYAHDIERVLVEASLLPEGRVAACGLFDAAAGADRLLLFAAVPLNDRGADVLLEARQRLRHALHLTPDALVPLRGSQFPRTSSGKLQRYRLRAAYERGTFAEAETQMAVLLAAAEARQQAKTAPRTWQERLLHRLWCETLGLPPEAVGVDDRFADLGGTSLHAATILGRLEGEYRIVVHSSVLAEHDTIAALAPHLGHRPSSGRSARFSG